MEPGTSQFYAFDNGAYTHYGTCGSISWQINDSSGNPVTLHGTSRRLLITYQVPYRYDCCKSSTSFVTFKKILWQFIFLKNILLVLTCKQWNSSSNVKDQMLKVLVFSTTCGRDGTTHDFSINVIHTFHNKTGHWKHPELVKNHYYNHHHSGTSGTYVRNDDWK